MRAAIAACWASGAFSRAPKAAASAFSSTWLSSSAWASSPIACSLRARRLSWSSSYSSQSIVDSSLTSTSEQAEILPLSMPGQSVIKALLGGADAVADPLERVAWPSLCGGGTRVVRACSRDRGAADETKARTDHRAGQLRGRDRAGRRPGRRRPSRADGCRRGRAAAATTATAPPSAQAPACANGLDDDGDGLVDLEDPDCLEPPTQRGAGTGTPPPTRRRSRRPRPKPAPAAERRASKRRARSTAAAGGAGGRSSTTRASAARPAAAAPAAASPRPARPRRCPAPDRPAPTAARRSAAAARPTAANPTTTFAPFGPAPIGVPNFVIDSFEIPPFLLPIYQACGTEYGIPWEVLASINKIETAFGTNLNVSSAGAIGWMQFLPSSWEAYGLDANGDGRKDPYNPVDAICAAAHYLKVAGGNEDLYNAIFAYNHADWYVAGGPALRPRLRQAARPTWSAR